MCQRRVKFHVLPTLCRAGMVQRGLSEPGLLMFGDLPVTFDAQLHVLDLVVQLDDGVQQHLRTGGQPGR